MTVIPPSLAQSTLWDNTSSNHCPDENPKYLQEQLITYIGNKRSLLPLVHDALVHVTKRLNRHSLTIFDGFAGSGIVSRYFKQYSTYLISNDFEKYAEVIGQCYLTNISEIDMSALRDSHEYLQANVHNNNLPEGIIRRLYSPEDDKNIKSGERVFYTNYNATTLDNYRRLIDNIPYDHRIFFLAPLMSQASVHANTSGVFKGFYKNSKTGIGQFGGNGRNALTRIMQDINLPFPVFSNYECQWEAHCSDTNTLTRNLRDLDIAYYDPPYNQHPYGSNYFMLNLLLEYQEPTDVSRVSGIPSNWQRSSYNKRKYALEAIQDLFEHTDARFILLSYNDEGFISRTEIEDIMRHFGSVSVYETPYNTFRGSRNLKDRKISVTEHLFLVEKK